MKRSLLLVLLMFATLARISAGEWIHFPA
ncbi:MAG: hypothetical protein JWM99_1611, partial [Verrucomicrobiales bacterium]|nr:hypothetical protein [Verrucomicrobiales bacterium]